MTEKTEAQTEEIQTEEQTAARKPDGVLTRKFGAKTLEIFVANVICVYGFAKLRKTRTTHT